MLCTRCHHFEAVQDGVLCTACSTRTGFQAPPTGLAPNAWLRSPVGLGRAAVAMLGLVALADVFALGTDVFQYVVRGDLADGRTGDDVLDRADTADLLTGVAGVGQGLSLLACAVVFVIWFWRVRVNAEVFSPNGHRKARGWVIGGWVAPFVNLWYPRRVMLDVWDASRPAGRTAGHGPVNAWWTLWLLSTIGGEVLYGIADSADTPRQIHEWTPLVMVADALDLVAAVLAALVVLKLTRLQDEKAHQGPAVPVPA
ncbi:DUF4328 domain-containing protein [Streptomyces sp. NPDC047072]|uniref:DUF4328 domain-containing protein n=1 Tax=Streptomyces sp. NPDC047072 TaxID=3154809 RepID=UPI0033D6091C